MWVEADQRGTGIADDLLAGVISWARAEGAHALRLGVAEDNPSARKFYERHGFAPTGESEPLRSRPTARTEERLLVFGGDE